MRRLELLAFALLLAPACRHRPTAVNVAVTYLGHDEAVQSPREVPKKRVFVAVENRIGTSTRIGGDAQTKVPILAEPSALTQLVDAAFRSELTRVGVPLAASAQAADSLLHIAVTGVNVEEGASYSARFTAVIEVTDPAGKSLWNATLVGAGSHTGEDYNGGEVNVTLNHAANDLVARVFANDQLMQPLGR